MRVCVVTTTFPRWEGDGQGAFIWEAVRALSNKGADMRVIAMHAPGLPVRSEMQGIPVWRPRYWRPERHEMLKREGAAGLPAVWQRHRWARLQVLPFGLVHASAIAAWGRDCDLIHAEWTLSAAAAVLAKPIHRRPILATLQGSDLFRVTSTALGARLTKAALVGCTRVTVLSHALEATAKLIGVPGAKLEIIPNGVDTEAFTPLPESGREDVVLFVGSLIPRKGVEYLLGAFPAVLAASPHSRLIVIGDGPQEAELRSLARHLNVADRVSFLGFLPQSQIRGWMQRARVFVLPSIEEGQGVVLLEALASGTPIVASNVDGILDVVAEDVGILVPPRTPTALASGILQVLGSGEKWGGWSAAARRRAESSYDWRNIATEYLGIYQQIAKE